MSVIDIVIIAIVAAIIGWGIWNITRSNGKCVGCSSADSCNAASTGHCQAATDMLANAEKAFAQSEKPAKE